MKEVAPANILILNHDWKNIAVTGGKTLIDKLNRDRLNPDFNNIFIISQTIKFGYVEVGKVKVFQIKTIFGKNRVIYDFLLPIFAPMILWYYGFKPDFMYIRDFPLSLSGLSLKLFFKTKTVFFLGTMPKELATIRSFATIRWLYFYISEVISKIIVDKYIANGNETKKYLIDMGIKSESIDIMVENIVAKDKQYIDSVTKGKIRKLYNIPEDKKVLLSVARLVIEKGFSRLFKALAELDRDDYILLVVGAGELREELENLSASLGMTDKIIFTGTVGRELIWNYYADADAFIFFSFSEGNPTVIREAMYSNLPIIGSTILPMQEFIGEDGERGYYWKPEAGKDDLNRKINNCLFLSPEVVEMKKRAKAYIDDNIKGTYIINHFLQNKV